MPFDLVGDSSLLLDLTKKKDKLSGKIANVVKQCKLNVFTLSNIQSINSMIFMVSRQTDLCVFSLIYF
jgi:hypothetical protein